MYCKRWQGLVKPDGAEADKRMNALSATSKAQRAAEALRKP